MFMQKIRQSTKKHRTVLLIVVILLAIGLVGTFAVWNSDNLDKNVGNQNTDQMTTAEQIALYESTIAQNEPAAGEELTYDTAGTLANLYMNLRALYYTAYSEAANDDVAAGKAYYDKSVNAAEKAVEYYQFQLDNAPDTLTDYVKAGIIGNQAAALSFTDDKDGAQALYDEALTLAPNNFEAATNYLSYVYANEGIDAAQAYADSYMELVGDQSTFYTNMKSQIDYLVWLEELYASLEDAQQQSQNDNGNADGDGTPADDSAE